MYMYFRRLASEAYAGCGLLAKDHDKQSEGTVLIGAFRTLVEDREGFYATVAMTMAYFSLLEHLLVLVLPVTDFDPTSDSVTDFIKLKLFEKYDKIFDASTDPLVHNFRQQLHKIAEQWRNPYGHGGFDKAHGNIWFHVPGIGPLPMLLSDIRAHATFGIVPTRESRFDQVCALFDQLDAWLREGPIRFGIQWAETSMDVAFNPEFLNAFRTAVDNGPESFDEFVERQADAVDRAMNM